MGEEVFLIDWILLNLTGRYRLIRELFSRGISTEDIISSLELGQEKLSLLRKKAGEEYKKAVDSGIELVPLSSDDYPYLLREISDPPALLYLLGEKVWLNGSFVSVVGTRKPSRYGINITKKIVSKLVENGIGIVSGFAYGIDTVAHMEALNGGGYTIGVLGTGVDIVYPGVNKGLKKEIIESRRGCFISEFPLGDKPEPWHFPRRNRIISGLTQITVVIEASLKSGAMITAGYALEQGREVFAVPGNADSENSQGTNQLIKEGAKLITSGEDILEEFNIIPKVSNIRPPELNPEEAIIWNILNEPRLEDDIISISGLDTGKFNVIVTRLELKGLIERLPGRMLKRRNG
ncbi:MAG TPA: DNA-processing protein DprA [bacterium]|nr:DNA-processing protein DprA [Dictyoglomota bacterium]HHV80940.1 DNA-protecting protein DprA [bacterium]HOP55830.1 DNA-processing protein DprA [bacterium]